MSEALVVKDVDFNGATLRAAQDINNVIWVGVRWVCLGMGMSEGQMKKERRRIHQDIVLQKGGSNMVLLSKGGEQGTLCLQLDYLPLWLAKISITPAMKRDNPELVEKLVEYQLKAKDVLADAFIRKKDPQTEKLNILEQKIDKMYHDMAKLSNLFIDWKEQVASALPKPKDDDGLNMDDIDSMILAEEIKELTDWKRQVYSQIDFVTGIANSFQERRKVLIHIYRYMTKNYGIVWSQIQRDYKKKHKTDEQPSIIETVYDNKSLKSIFNSILSDIVRVRTRELEQERKTTEEASKEERSWCVETLKPLAKKYGSTRYVGWLYRKVYSCMGWVDWDSIYESNPDMIMLSKKKIIDQTPMLQERFKTAVEKLLLED